MLLHGRATDENDLYPILDVLDPAEVRVMTLKNGRSFCKPLTEHPDWKEWKGALRVGEFWSWAVWTGFEGVPGEFATCKPGRSSLNARWLWK